jgi:hypothetical protein
MRKENYFIGLLIFLMTLLLACGGDEGEQKLDISALLPANLPTIGLERVSEIRTFDNKGLWEYINGGAELYLNYNFIEVATADYKQNDIEIVVDLYRFASEDDAFGLYSMFRTPDVQIIRLGVEGFTAPASLNFAKGKFLVRLVGYDETNAGGLALINLAEEIGKLISGTSNLPAMFDFFPSENQIGATEKYYIESFLGQKSLHEVYARDYFSDGDSLNLFLTYDSTGTKYMEWNNIAEKTGRGKPAPKGLPYDEGYTFIIEDSFYGEIIVGLRNQKLAGIVNYNEKHRELLANWLNSLQ